MFEREGIHEKTLNQSIKTKLAAAGQLAKKKERKMPRGRSWRRKMSKSRIVSLKIRLILKTNIIVFWKRIVHR
eukprot:UN07561